MINEKTWHPAKTKQTHFVWEATESGLELHHSTGSASHVISWQAFYEVLEHARNQAQSSNAPIVAGCSMTSPPAGSIGAWVKTKKLKNPKGALTPRHLSFLGPIYKKMGFISRVTKGNSILWKF